MWGFSGGGVVLKISLTFSIWKEVGPGRTKEGSSGEMSQDFRYLGKALKVQGLHLMSTGMKKPRPFFPLSSAFPIIPRSFRESLHFALFLKFLF